MATFKFTFSRRVVTYDSFERDIEAPDLATAESMADEMADESNHSCPDDASPGDDAEFGDWFASQSTD